MKTFITNALCKNKSILFFAFLLFFFAHSPLNAATTIFDNGLESGNLSGYETRLSGGSGTVTVASSPVANGKYSKKHYLPYVSTGRNYRAETVLSNGKGNFTIGEEYWFSFNYFYQNWASDTMSEIGPFQVHERPSSQSTSSCQMGSAVQWGPFLMLSSNNEERFYTFGGKVRWKASLKSNKWQNITVHFRPSPSSTGFIEAWKDGVKLFRTDGANMPKYDKCGKLMGNPYLVSGIYKYGWKSNKSNVTSRTLLIDDLKIQKGSSTYSASTTSTSTSTTNSTSTSSTSTSTSTSDLVAYWPFNTWTSTTTPDVSGNGYTGTLANGAYLTSSKTLKLDGVNDYVNVGRPAVSGNAMTISAWLWSDNLANCSSSDCRIISKAIGLSEQDHDFMISTVKVNSETRLRFRLNTNGATSTLVAGSGNILNREWAHVAAVYDGKSMRLYQDGQLVGSRSKTGNITFRNTGSTWIGGNPPSATSRPWKGQIDDVAIYNYALTSSEIAQLAK